MRFPILITSALGASAALLLISCSGPGASSTSALPSTAQPSFAQSQSRMPAVAAAEADLSRSCPDARIYIADYFNSDIEIYPYTLSTSLKPCGIITRGILGPSGITIDNEGTLYVSDYIVSGVTVFPKNATKPSRTILTASLPQYAFVGADGTLYVPESYANQVEVFAPGAKSPERTIAVTNPWGVATDSKNNLYVVSDACSAGTCTSHVIRYAPGAKPGTDLGIAAAGHGYGIKVTKDNSIVLGVQVNTDNPPTANINVYPPGATMPSRSFPTIVPFDIALSQDETRIVVASSSHSQQAAVYDFSAGALLESITGLNEPDGAAFYPPAPH